MELLPVSGDWEIINPCRLKTPALAEETRSLMQVRLSSSSIKLKALDDVYSHHHKPPRTLSQFSFPPGLT